MDKLEIQEAIREIGLMMRAFPSSQSSITKESVQVYLEAVEDYDIEAVASACKAFRKGLVQGHNADFAPSAPKLSIEVKNQQDRLRWQAHLEANDFVEVDSDDWRKIEQYRGRTPPVTTRGGVLGWFIPKLELSEARKIELPAPVSEEKRAMIGRDLKKLAAGDRDGDRDVA